MKRLAKTRLSSFWLMLFFLIVTCVALNITNNASARCVNGYCYDTGTSPSGGSCGDPSHTGTWWDTCFGLSWQYYEWPANWDKNIVMFGSDSSGGNATINKKCKKYGGFWFFGYEAYTPSTGVSKGYQIARPKTSMLKAYGGKNPLFPYDRLEAGNDGSGFTPSENPYISTYNSGLSSLKGSRYGKAAEVAEIFDALIGENLDISDTLSFDDVNWFCAYKDDPPPPDPCLIDPDSCDDTEETPQDDPDPDDPNPVQTSYARGRSVVKASDDNWARTTWSNSGDVVRISVDLIEGESQDITFKHRVIAKGKLAQMVGYKVTDSTEQTLLENFLDYPGVTMSESETIYSDTITVDSAGSYCQSLQITYERPTGTQNRYSTACVDVTVTPIPPEMFGRVEVTVGNQTASSEWDGGVENPAIVDVTIQEGQTVDVIFNDYLKAVDGSDMKLKYEITNSYYLGRKQQGYLDYHLDTDSGVEQEVAVNSVDNIGKRMTVCETLRYWAGGTERSAQACARITMNRNVRTLGSPNAKTAYIDFSAQINPYITLKVGSSGLIKTGGILELLRSGTDICITTNNISGYTATITSGTRSADANATSLYNRYSKNYIPTLAAPTLKSEFPVNHWGFSFDDTEEGDDNSTYNNLVPLDSENPYVFSESDHADEKTHNVYFAAMTDVNQASGTYSAGVSLRAVAGIVPYLYNSIDEITYMQDINDNVIDSMVTDQQYKLYDQRDGKSYWVAKMEDGNVWMTQNLDFELKEGDRLFEGDSDVSHHRDASSSYLDIARSTSKDVYEPWAVNNTEKRRYGQTDYTAGVLLSGGHSYRPADDTGTYSASFSLRLDDGSMSYSNPTIPRYLFYGTGAVPMDKDYCMSYYTEEQCEHWSTGIYYSPDIAHGDTFEGTGGQIERNTICPGRWTLPTAKEFESLVAGKQLNTLYIAPYYMTASGLYGVRNQASGFSQWLASVGFITYLNKEERNISSYPIGLTPDNVYSNPSYSSASSRKASSADFGGLGATVRCVARRGY